MLLTVNLQLAQQEMQGKAQSTCFRGAKLNYSEIVCDPLPTHLVEYNIRGSRKSSPIQETSQGEFFHTFSSYFFSFSSIT
jgi:hypothetical protein